MELAEDLRAMIMQEPLRIAGDQSIQATISIGISGGRGSELQLDMLVDRADAAMYAAKSLGRNRTYLFRELDEGAQVRKSPISAERRAQATAIGQWASDTATQALASVLAPQPHHRGRPSDMIASLATGIGLEMGLPAEEIERPPDGGGAETGGDGAPAATGRIAPSSKAAPAVGRTTSGTDDDATPATDGLLNMVLLVGLSGVAAVALIGVAVMLAGRRRDHDDEAAVPAAASFAARATTSSPDATPDAVLERRMLRQSRVRMTDDPIVAALGIGNDDDDRRRARRKAGQVGRGPGERPNISRN